MTNRIVAIVLTLGLAGVASTPASMQSTTPQPAQDQLSTGKLRLTALAVHMRPRRFALVPRRAILASRPATAKGGRAGGARSSSGRALQRSPTARGCEVGSLHT